jgi:hypothetical protein
MSLQFRFHATSVMSYFKPGDLHTSGDGHVRHIWRSSLELDQKSMLR